MEPSPRPEPEHVPTPPRQRPLKHEREMANFVALTRDLGDRRTRWESRPFLLEYSTNSACNLRCIMCSQVDDPPVISTPRELRGPFLEEVFEHTTVLVPSATSEPLLNSMGWLLPLCEKHGVYLDIITNAMLLTPEILQQMAPRLHRLTISLDSHEKAVLEKLRAPAVFETIVEHSRHAAEVTHALSIPLVIHMVLALDCMHDLPGFVDFVADEIGARSITVLELLPNSPLFTELDPFAVLGEEEVGRRLEAMRARCEERGVSLVLEVHAPLGGRHIYGQMPTRVHSGSALDLLQHELAQTWAGFCPHVMHYFKVEPDGRAYPCCRAPRELELGNVFDQGVEAVWNGAPMRELRERMFRGDYPECCVGCVVLEGPMNS